MDDVMSDSKILRAYTSFCLIECSIYSFEFFIINACARNIDFLKYDGIACGAFCLLTTGSVYYHLRECKKENKISEEKKIFHSNQHPPLLNHIKSDQIDNIMIMYALLAIAFSMETCLIFIATSSLSLPELIARSATLLVTNIIELRIASYYRKQVSAHNTSIALPTQFQPVVRLPETPPKAHEECIEINNLH